MRILVLITLNLMVVITAYGEEKRSPDSATSISAETSIEIETQTSHEAEPWEEPTNDLEPIEEIDYEEMEGAPQWEEL